MCLVYSWLMGPMKWNIFRTLLMSSMMPLPSWTPLSKSWITHRLRAVKGRPGWTETEFSRKITLLALPPFTCQIISPSTSTSLLSFYCTLTHLLPFTFTCLLLFTSTCLFHFTFTHLLFPLPSPVSSLPPPVSCLPSLYLHLSPLYLHLSLPLYLHPSPFPLPSPVSSLPPPVSSTLPSPISLPFAFTCLLPLSWLVSPTLHLFPPL